MNKKQQKELEAMQKERDGLEDQIEKLYKQQRTKENELDNLALKYEAWHPMSDLGKYYNCKSIDTSNVWADHVDRNEAAYIETIRIVYEDHETKKLKIFDVECDTSDIVKNGRFYSTHEYFGLFRISKDWECYHIHYGDTDILGKVKGFLCAELRDKDSEDFDIPPVWVSNKKK